MQPQKVGPNAQGKRRRSTEGAHGTNKGQDNGEAMALVGVRLTAQLGGCAKERAPGTRRSLVAVQLNVIGTYVVTSTGEPFKA